MRIQPGSATPPQELSDGLSALSRLTARNIRNRVENVKCEQSVAFPGFEPIALWTLREDGAKAEERAVARREEG